MTNRLVRCLIRPAAIVATVGGILFLGSSAHGFESLGVGTDALIGGDLTDVDDDGDPEEDDGYDAIFDASHEPGFGSENADPASAGNGESAFNVFDNILGPANDKWCCGDPNGIDEDEPMWVSAEFPSAYRLTNFTVSSANDADGRDPIYWAIQGSNDGVEFTNIYVYEDDFGPWEERLEVIEWTAGEDFPVQTEAYSIFRMATFDTINFQNGDAAYFQIGEIEFFGEADAGGPAGDFDGSGAIDAADLDILAGYQQANDLAGDLNGDGITSFDDRFELIKSIPTWVGDSNLDGEFNSSDFVAVFTAGLFETGNPATWETGDWNGDGVFSSSDFVSAFSDGGFETGPVPATAAVPEPTSGVLTMLSFFGLFGVTCRRNK